MTAPVIEIPEDGDSDYIPFFEVRVLDCREANK